jgi:hypothetical protein
VRRVGRRALELSLRRDEPRALGLSTKCDEGNASGALGLRERRERRLAQLVHMRFVVGDTCARSLEPCASSLAVIRVLSRRLGRGACLLQLELRVGEGAHPAYGIGAVVPDCPRGLDHTTVAQRRLASRTVRAAAWTYTGDVVDFEAHALCELAE